MDEAFSAAALVGMCSDVRMASVLNWPPAHPQLDAVPVPWYGATGVLQSSVGGSARALWLASLSSNFKRKFKSNNDN